ncbi:MAG: septum site-determining protein MinD [Ruminococcaceae bacterium]|nr:septum site-determining protein MinD [Oscillospiraceae bacterium]
MGKLIVVASGKGGVGKTTLTANLAACLAERGNRVLAVDCDIYLKNLDIVFGMSDDHIWDSSDVYAGRCTVDDAIVHVNGKERLYLLSAPLRSPDDPDGLSEFLLKTAKKLLDDNEYDYIVMDCPSGIGRGIDSFFTRGSHVIVVATPDVTSIHDAERVAAAAYESHANVSLVVNRVRAKAIENGTAPNIDDVIDRVSVRLIGLIPEDSKTSEALNAEQLVIDIKRARSKKAYVNIAARIDGEFTELYKFW